MFVLQAHPAGGSLSAPSGPPLFYRAIHVGNERKGTLSPATLHIPSVILISEYASAPGPSYSSTLCQQWAEQILLKYMGVQTPTLKRAKLSDHLLIYTLSLAGSFLMCFSPLTWAQAQYFPSPL